MRSLSSNLEWWIQSLKNRVQNESFEIILELECSNLELRVQTSKTEFKLRAISSDFKMMSSDFEKQGSNLEERVHTWNYEFELASEIQSSNLESISLNSEFF